jgi:O-antigen ligase
VFLSFLAFVVVRYIQLGARRDFLATMRVEFLIGIVVIVLVSMQLVQRTPRIGHARSIVYGIGALFLAILVQLPFAADPILAQKIFMDRVIKFAFLTYFMTVMIESPKNLVWFLAAFLFSVYYVTLEAVEGLISGSLVWQNQGVMRLHGAVPIYQHPNSLAGVAMGALPFVVFLFKPVRHKIFQLGLLATLVTSSLCVVYSGSRTAYVGLIAFLLWWWFQSQRKWRLLVYMVFLGAIFLAVVPDQYIERFQSIGGQEKEGHSRQTRIVILEDAIAIFLEHPWGVGVASFPAVRMARFGRVQDTHNLYLEVATNLGIQGLLIFLYLVTVMMLGYRRAMKSFGAQQGVLTALAPQVRHDRILSSDVRRHYRDLEFLIGTAKAAGGFILIRLVLGLFGMDLYEVYWWFGAGLAIVLYGLMESTARNTVVLTNMCDQGQIRDSTPSSTSTGGLS